MVGPNDVAAKRSYDGQAGALRDAFDATPVMDKDTNTGSFSSSRPLSHYTQHKRRESTVSLNFMSSRTTYVISLKQFLFSRA